MKLTLSLALAIFGASAVSAKASTITKCTTSYEKGSGSTTQIAPATSSKVTVTVAPVATHTVTVVGSKATKSTAVISLVKKTITNNAVTDTWTSTSTSFEFVIPRTTVTADPYYTTSTSVSYEFLPASTYTNTVYDLAAASPILPSPEPSDRRRDLHRNIRQQPRSSKPQALRKEVKCTPVVENFVTVTAGKAKKTATITHTSHPTVTVTQTKVATVTNTYVPADVREVDIVTATSTVSASTLTFTSTPTLVVPTTLVIDRQPIIPAIKQLVSGCQLAQQQTQQAVSYRFNYFSSQQYASLGDYPDQATCCSQAASVPGAFAFAWNPYYDSTTGGGYCEAGFQTDIETINNVQYCGASVSPFFYTDTITAENQYTIGLLQCGEYFLQPNLVTNYNNDRK